MENEAKAPEAMEVHALHCGRSLCGKPGPPSAWEPHEHWVAVEDWRSVRATFGRQAQCGACQVAYVSQAERPSIKDVESLQREVEELTQHGIHDMIRLYLQVRAQVRILKYGHRTCGKCDRLLHLEEEPDYRKNLCDEHREERGNGHAETLGTER